MSKAAKSNWALTALVTVMACWLTVGLLGCGGSRTSAGADVKELQQAFGLKASDAPSEEPTVKGVASRTVAALRAQDWPKALSLLSWIRLNSGLTLDQARAVQDAYANAHLRLTELAARGNAEAKAALDRAKQEADGR